MMSNDQKIIDEILRMAIVACRNPGWGNYHNILRIAETLRKKGLVSSKVKLRWAKIEHDMDREILSLGGKPISVSGDETGDSAKAE